MTTIHESGRMTMYLRRIGLAAIVVALNACVTVNHRRPLPDTCADRCLAQCDFAGKGSQCLTDCKSWCGIATRRITQHMHMTHALHTRPDMTKTEPAIAPLNSKVITLRDCPRPSAQVGARVTITADIRLRLINRHTAPLDVTVIAYIENATTDPANVRWTDLGVINVPVGEMDRIRTYQLPREFIFTTAEGVTLDAVCRLEWQIDSDTDSTDRGTSCSFAVVATIPNPFDATAAGARHA